MKCNRYACALLILTLFMSLVLSLSPAHITNGLLVNDKLAHFFGYFILMMLLDFAYLSGRHLIFKICVIVSYSVVIEVVQNFIPGREMSLYDGLANVLGVMSFVCLLPYIQKFQLYRRSIKLRYDN